MQITDRIIIGNTNGNRRQYDRLTVYRDRMPIARVCPPSRNPLRYVRIHPRSAYRVSLIEQLRIAGCSEAEISMITT